jgi:hypothetical protein
LDTVAVVYIDVDVQYPGMNTGGSARDWDRLSAVDVPQHFQYAENNIVDIAEARCFSLLRVVKPAAPVDCNIGRPVCESSSSSQGSTSILLAE